MSYAALRFYPVRIKGKESKEKAKKFVTVLCAAKQAKFPARRERHSEPLEPV